MSDSQFYIAVFVPILVILLGQLASHLRTDAKIDGLEKEIDVKFDTVDQRLSRVETNIDQVNNETRRDHEQRITRPEERLLKAS